MENFLGGKNFLRKKVPEKFLGKIFREKFSKNFSRNFLYKNFVRKTVRRCSVRKIFSRFKKLENIFQTIKQTQKEYFFWKIFFKIQTNTEKSLEQLGFFWKIRLTLCFLQLGNEKVKWYKQAVAFYILRNYKRCSFETYLQLHYSLPNISFFVYAVALHMTFWLQNTVGPLTFTQLVYFTLATIFYKFVNSCDMYSCFTLPFVHSSSLCLHTRAIA